MGRLNSKRWAIDAKLKIPTLDKVSREGLSEKVTLQWRPEAVR